MRVSLSAVCDVLGLGTALVAAGMPLAVAQHDYIRNKSSFGEAGSLIVAGLLTAAAVDAGFKRFYAPSSFAGRHPYWSGILLAVLYADVILSMGTTLWLTGDAFNANSFPVASLLRAGYMLGLAIFPVMWVFAVANPFALPIGLLVGWLVS